jgi:hypothetical protein
MLWSIIATFLMLCLQRCKSCEGCCLRDGNCCTAQHNRRRLFCLATSGNARWSPAVSEYRQANNLKYPMQNAAAEMLTAVPPVEAAELLDATAQFTTTGR